MTWTASVPEIRWQDMTWTVSVPEIRWQDMTWTASVPKIRWQAITGTEALAAPCASVPASSAPGEGGDGRA